MTSYVRPWRSTSDLLPMPRLFRIILLSIYPHPPHQLHVCRLHVCRLSPGLRIQPRRRSNSETRPKASMLFSMLCPPSHRWISSPGPSTNWRPMARPPWDSNGMNRYVYSYRVYFDAVHNLVTHKQQEEDAQNIRKVCSPSRIYIHLDCIPNICAHREKQRHASRSRRPRNAGGLRGSRMLLPTLPCLARHHFGSCLAHCHPL